ncbi:DUF7344 domain-containing protein [Natrinema soli]|uniref:DUF7344 domain-containing protein n=1 Tax=Natrinema soli TaxID=1930624 RepID=UPI003CCD73C1
MLGISLSVDAVFEVLAHHHRHVLLRFLSNAPERTATVDEVAAHLMKQEAQRIGEQPGRDQVEMAIHHIHLPMLTEVGIVEYDVRSTELRYW